jgi:hypothetical protein
MLKFAPSFCCFHVESTVHRSNVVLHRSVSLGWDGTSDQCAFPKVE